VTAPINQRLGLGFAQHQVIGNQAKLNKFLVFFGSESVIFVTFQRVGLPIALPDIGLSVRDWFSSNQPKYSSQSP
jgi:hypothetical protein